MIKHLLLFVLLFYCGGEANAQIAGIVVDSSTKEPVAYVNIWVDGENVGGTSELNGRFSIPFKGASYKGLKLHALGYAEKFIPASKFKDTIYLVSRPIELAEVVIKPQKKKQLQVGTFKKKDVVGYFGISNSKPWIIARYFSYKAEFASTPYIEKVKILTQCNVSKAKFILHLYSVDSAGKPADDLSAEAIIGIAKRGEHFTEIDISHLGFRFPEKGFFVAFEWLVIEENKHEWEYYDMDGKKIKGNIRYEPSLGELMAETGQEALIYSHGKWHMTIFHSKERAEKIKVSSPAFYNKIKDKYSLMAVELTLTN